MDKIISSSKPNVGYRSERIHLHAADHPSGTGRLCHKALKNKVYIYVKAKSMLKLPQQMYIVSLNATFHLPLSAETLTPSVLSTLCFIFSAPCENNRNKYIFCTAVLLRAGALSFFLETLKISFFWFLFPSKKGGKKPSKPLCILPTNHSALLSPFHKLKHVGIS